MNSVRLFLPERIFALFSRMDFEKLVQLCGSLNGAEDTYPFGPEHIVWKVSGKMFALHDAVNPQTINLKCDPDRASELRAEYDGIQPGYHMNKKHWNTVLLRSDVSPQLLTELIRHSYDLVVLSLTKKQRDELAAR